MAARARVLIVEDDAALRSLMALALSREYDVVHVDTVRKGIRELRHSCFDILVTDVRLPDGDAIRLVRAAARSKHFPRVVAVSGVADASQAFALSAAGVVTFLPKPFGLDTLERAVKQAAASFLSLEPTVSMRVGSQTLRELEQTVRDTMIERALAQADGNVTNAARILGITRQALQNALKARPERQ